MLVAALCHSPVLWRYQMFLGGASFNMWQGIGVVRLAIQWYSKQWAVLALVYALVVCSWGAPALTCGKEFFNIWQAMVSSDMLYLWQGW